MTYNVFGGTLSLTQSINQIFLFGSVIFHNFQAVSNGAYLLTYL